MKADAFISCGWACNCKRTWDGASLSVKRANSSHRAMCADEFQLYTRTHTHTDTHTDTHTHTKESSCQSESRKKQSTDRLFSVLANVPCSRESTMSHRDRQTSLCHTLAPASFTLSVSATNHIFITQKKSCRVISKYEKIKVYFLHFSYRFKGTVELTDPYSPIWGHYICRNPNLQFSA